MESGFKVSEAQDMIGLAFAVNLLGPGGFGLPLEKVEDEVTGKSKFRFINKKRRQEKLDEARAAGDAAKLSPIDFQPDFSSSRANPLKTDNGLYHPYPKGMQVWPEGWEPHLSTSATDQNPWKKSVLIPGPTEHAIDQMADELLGKYSGVAKAVRNLLKNQLMSYTLGANNVVVTRHAETGAYTIAFAGTQNFLGMIQDASFCPVSAGKLDFKWYKSDTAYFDESSYEWDGSGINRKVKPALHLGFRIAVEQFTVKATPDCSLIDIIREMKNAKGKDHVELYITGHSLGAAMASLFTAWLYANRKNYSFPELDIKMYAFATPKTSNGPLMDDFNMGLTSQGKAFHVDNSLDTIPQIPFTIQSLKSLNNPAMLPGIGALYDEGNDEGLAGRLRRLNEVLRGSDWPDNNYGHLGCPIPLKGKLPLELEPGSTEVPARYFKDNKPKLINDIDEVYGEDITVSWWQHWPWVYREILDETYR